VILLLGLAIGIAVIMNNRRVTRRPRSNPVRRLIARCLAPWTGLIAHARGFTSSCRAQEPIRLAA